jgi:hypothetical protein
MHKIGYWFPSVTADTLQTTETPPRNDDSTSVPTTEWVRDHIGEQSSNLTVFKCGVRNMAQGVTNYLKAVGYASTATEADAQVHIGMPTEIYAMKIYCNEAIPAGQTLTITVRKNGVSTTLTTTITGLTIARTVVSVTGSVIFGKNYAGTLDALSVLITTSASFGTTNDINVSLLAKVPNSNYKPVSPFAFGAQVAGNFTSGGEFKTLVYDSAVLNTVLTRAQFPVTNQVMEKFDQAVNTAWPYLGGTSAGQVTGNYNLYIPGGTTVSFAEETGLLEHTEYVVFSDRQAGGDTGTWSPLVFSSSDQLQNTDTYMGGYGYNTQATTSYQVNIPLPAGKVWRLAAYAAANAIPAGETALIRVLRNNDETDLQVQLTDTARYKASLQRNVTFNENDVISVLCRSSALAGTNTYHAVLELDKND